MVAGRIQSIKLAIEGMREPGERVPVRGVSRRPGPYKCAPGQPGSHVRILDDIGIIVEIDKGMALDRTVENRRKDYQQQAKNREFPGSTVHRAFDSFGRIVTGFRR